MSEFSESGKQKSAKNFFSAGLSLIQQVAGRNGGDSSDDEATDLNEDEDYIQRGTRGVLVFPIQSIRTGKKKTIHLNLYKSQMIQYYESKKKVFSCDNIVNFVRTSEKSAQIEFRGMMEMQTRVKKFLFENESHAEKFHQYVEFLIELGKGIRQSWNQIDIGKRGKVLPDDLQAALARVDLPSDEGTIEKMIQFGAAGFDCVDYYGFFHMFLFSYVSNLRECLQEWLTRATAEKDSGVGNNPLLKLLPGEIVTFAPNERLHWSVFGGKSCKQPFFVPGVMYMTNYRIVLISTRKSPPSHVVHSRYDVPPFFAAISIPLANIYKHYSAPPRNSVFIVCKDYRVVQFTLSGFLNNKSKVDTFMQLISGLSYMTSDTDAKQHFFAFKYHPDFAKLDHGWKYTDLVKEYVRQGIYDMSNHWKVFENMDYTLSDTYPLHIVLPRKMTNDQIATAAAFRSRGRLPAITYLHQASKAVMARSAQPLVGLTQKNCPEDELLLNFYRLKGVATSNTTTSSTSAANTTSSENPAAHHTSTSLSNNNALSIVNQAKLYILDARGRIAANLNMAAGKGTEDVSSYFNAELVFGNIENIHVMRNSANALAECLSPDVHPYSNMKEVLTSSEGSGSGYSYKIEDSGWLKHIRLILVSAVFAAEKLHFDGHSVLVHCSDGWDRTAQICATTQVLLDPFFRTIEGLAVLIEKDWCAFGHKFQERTGVGMDNNVQADERSPVFIQFLDCLYQLIQQFPTCFEYNDTLLIFIVNHLHSALFGNFLGNSEKERMIELQCQTNTVSIWSYVLTYQEIFKNKDYQRYQSPIWPSVAIHKMKIWERYWMRWDITSHPNALVPASHQWIDDWGDLHL